MQRAIHISYTTYVCYGTIKVMQPPQKKLVVLVKTALSNVWPVGGSVRQCKHIFDILWI